MTMQFVNLSSVPGLLRCASDWLKITPPDRRRSAEKSVLKEATDRLVGIVGVHVTMSVAHTNMVHALHLRFGQ
jgi:hypothetical protein